jgi:hypothetical protein
MVGKFILKKGEKLKILIGQQGTRDFLDPRRAGGGGGGTFVVKNNGHPLLIAGGGGGGGIPPPAGKRFNIDISFVCNLYQLILKVFNSSFPDRGKRRKDQRRPEQKRPSEWTEGQWWETL